MKFEVKGRMKIKGSYRPFTRVVEAQTENFAKQKIFSLFGSEHGIKRRFIIIESIKSLQE